MVRFDRGDGMIAMSPEAMRQLTDAARSFEDDRRGVPRPPQAAVQGKVAVARASHAGRSDQSVVGQLAMAALAFRYWRFADPIASTPSIRINLALTSVALATIIDL